MKKYDAHFLLKYATISSRKTIKNRHIIDAGTFDEPSIRLRHNVGKSEEIKIELILVSSGKTKKIENEKILTYIFKQLDSNIS